MVAGKEGSLTKLRLYDCRLSDLPTLIGLCKSDVQGAAAAVNRAQRRLLYAREAGDEGWWGTWAEMAFNVQQGTPYVTCPRNVARLEYINLCERPIPLYNQFFEYLQYGNGRLPKTFSTCRKNWFRAAYTRNSVPTFTDLGPTPQEIAVTLTDQADVGLRVLVQGLDNNGNPVVSQDGLNQVQGVFVTLGSIITFATYPGQTTPILWNQITGIQKDVTSGQVQLLQVDPGNGLQQVLVTMDGGEQTASYRRYYFDNVPSSCCFQTGTSVPQGTGTATLTAIAKLDLVPVVSDTDYCLLQNLEAIIEEAQSARYDSVDNGAGKQMAMIHHKNAIGLLNSELTHFLGKNHPSVDFAPFGTARLERNKIGSLV